MASEIFQSSRGTRGNLFFPTYIEVSDKAVSRRKRSWFRMDEMSISISKVASVHIKTGLIWSEILIESSGGSDPLPVTATRKEMRSGSRNLSRARKRAWPNSPKSNDE